MFTVTLTVILPILLLNLQETSHGFRLFNKFSRSVDTRQFYPRNMDTSQFTFPQSPCPEIFQYRNENGDLIGFIRVDQADPDGRVQLDVELSVGNSVQDYNGKIVLAADRQKVVNDIMNRKPIFYRVLFPAWQNIPPKVTKILVNGNLICSGPRIPIQMVPVLTTINLQHKLSLDVTPLISASDPDSSTFNSLQPVFNNQGNQNAQQFDIRADNLPTIPNNIFTDFSPSGKRPENSFQTVSNPFNFNPSPGQSEARPQNGRQINPQNPFLNGLSTPQPSRSEINSNNPFLNQRTERPSFGIPQTTSTPSRGGAPSGTINGPINEICGRPLPTNSLIVNGQTVPRGAYPWLVAIFRQVEYSSVSLNYICSGSLISHKHVVTAAHCVKIDHTRVKPNEIVCFFGKLNIRKWVTSPEELTLEPDSITIHPDYQPGKAHADIAVLTFPDPIPFSSMIMPICLWSGSSDLNRVVGNIGTVVGWGRDENGDVSTAEPRQVSMPIVDQYRCLKDSSSIAGQALIQITSENTFCAGFRNGSGPCNGDSGSGFLLERNGVFYLRGIVSTALSEATRRSCNLKEYVVFTDASKYIDWIRRILRN